MLGGGVRTDLWPPLCSRRVAETRRTKVMPACPRGHVHRLDSVWVIQHHVIGLQMRAEGRQKYITAMFPPGLCFLSHEERLEFKTGFGPCGKINLK